MNIRIAILAILFSFTSLFGFAQAEKPEVFKGIVLDAQSNEPISSAYLEIINLEYGVTTNEKGQFSLTVTHFSEKKIKLKISSVGYKSENIILSRDKKQLTIKLQSDTRMLKELVVKNKKLKYRNKNNPAVELIEKVIANKNINKKEALDYYQNEKYEKVQFALNDITPEFKQKKIFKHFQFVFDNTDTTKEKGKEMLPIYLKETLSDCYYRKTPKESKEIIKANKMVNFEGSIDNQGIADYLKYIYQDINIYDNDVTFLTNQFLSPIASSAPSFYRYYIIDTVQVESSKCIRVFFSSRNKEDLLFQGNLYITQDGSYAIKKADLTVNKNINLNWVRDVKIIQQFDKTPNNGWVISLDELSIDFGFTQKTNGIFGQRTVSYKNYSFNPPSKDSVFAGKNIVELDSANTRNDIYWDTHRHEKLTKSERGTYTVIDSIQKVPIFKKTMDIAGLLLFGYKNMGYFEIGPINTFYSYNPIEGPRARFGGRTTPMFSKKLNLETYLAYGFKDEQFKYYLGSTWSFTPRTIYQFPVKSIKVSYQNETKIPGQDLQFVQEDNVLLSIKRGVNDKLFYNKTFKVEHLNEFENHFSYTLGYQFTKETPGGNLYFNYTDYLSHQNDVNSLNISEFYLNLRYAPHEKFYQGKNYRTPVSDTYPVFELQYNIGSKLWHNDYNYQNLRFSITKRFYFSVLGYSDVIWESGKIFGKVPYPLLDIHRANQTYSYQILSYNLMNFLEFASDEYTSLNIDHCFNGFFLNKIPLIKHLKLREMVTCKILYGDVSKNNNPNYNSDLFKYPVESDGTPITYALGKTPYIEGSVGVGNIFKFFRVDLVKRFTYLDNPHVSSLGLRMRFKFDF